MPIICSVVLNSRHVDQNNIGTEHDLILPESQLLERFDRIRVWQQGDRRAEQSKVPESISF